MSNISDPFSAILVNSYDTIELSVTKRKFQIYKSSEIQDDIGWIFPNVNVTSFPSSLDYEFSDFTLKEINDPLLHRFLMYFGKNKDVYKRSYTKIQEIFGQIGGFSNFFYLIILYIYDLMRGSFKNKEIIKRIHLDHSHFRNKINSIHENQLQVKSNNIQKSEINSEISFKNIHESSRRLTLHKIFFMETKPDQTITYQTYIRSIFCSKNMNTQEQFVIIDYMENNKYIDNVFDVVTFVKFFTEFQNLKKIILNDHQILALKLLKQIYSNDENDIETIRNNLIPVFAENRNKEKINAIDKKILEIFIIEEEKRNNSIFHENRI